MQVLSAEKDSIFDQLQLRQAELESSQSHLEVLQSQATELQYQLRETNDRLSLASEELSEFRRDQESKEVARGSSLASSSSAEDVARLLSSAEVKYEAKIAELRRQLAGVEAERDEVEVEWSRKLDARAREVERLRAAVDSSARTRQSEEDVVEGLRAEIAQLREEVRGQRGLVEQWQGKAEQLVDVEVGVFVFGAF